MCPTISLIIGTSPEKMYSVDSFRKSVIMMSWTAPRGSIYVHCEVRKTKHPSEVRLVFPRCISVQHAKNSGMMLCCNECGMWRLIYASQKLKAQEKQLLEHALGGLCFSCRSLLYRMQNCLKVCKM